MSHGSKIKSGKTIKFKPKENKHSEAKPYKRTKYTIPALLNAQDYISSVI